MVVHKVPAIVQSVFKTRRHALNTLDALRPEGQVGIYLAETATGEEVCVLETHKEVALIEGVEYNVLKVEDPKEGIENAE